MKPKISCSSAHWGLKNYILLLHIWYKLFNIPNWLETKNKSVNKGAKICYWFHFNLVTKLFFISNWLLKLPSSAPLFRGLFETDNFLLRLSCVDHSKRSMALDSKYTAFLLEALDSFKSMMRNNTMVENKDLCSYKIEDICPQNLIRPGLI